MKEGMWKCIVSGFCREALFDKELEIARLNILKDLSEKIKKENKNIEDLNAVSRNYTEEFRKMLIDDGTLKQAIRRYYNKRKVVEIFTLIE